MKLRIADEGRQVIGMAWIKGQTRPYYDKREIKRGKHKGKIAVWYLAQSKDYGLILRSVKVHPDDIIS